MSWVLSQINLVYNNVVTKDQLTFQAFFAKERKTQQTGGGDYFLFC